MRFSYDNVHFKKHEQENWLMVTGEITNDSGKNYNAVVFRMVLFIKSIPIGNISINVKGFHAGQTKTFEVQMGELEYSLIPQISRYEIYPESAY